MVIRELEPINWSAAISPADLWGRKQTIPVVDQFNRVAR